MNSKGKAGEDFAAQELIKLGYKVLKRNYFSRYGEIDIIAVSTDGDEICFVEVKVRRQNAMVSAEESITFAKQRKIIKTALLYTQEAECALQPRFDLFSVEVGRNGEIMRHDHMKGAFDGSAYEQNN